MKAGEITFLGENLAYKTEKEMEAIRGRDISMIFQDPMTSLNPTIRIGKQISESLIKHQKMSKVEAKKEAANNADSEANHHGKESSGVARRLTLKEELGSNDVTNAISSEDDSRCSDTLGVSSQVACRHLKSQDERSNEGGGHVVSE